MRGLLDIKYCADYNTIKINTMQDAHTNKIRSMLERKVMGLVTYEPMCVCLLLCECPGVVANKRAGPINRSTIRGPVLATLVFFIECYCSWMASW